MYENKIPKLHWSFITKTYNAMRWHSFYFHVFPLQIPLWYFSIFFKILLKRRKLYYFSVFFLCLYFFIHLSEFCLCTYIYNWWLIKARWILWFYDEIECAMDGNKLNYWYIFQDSQWIYLIYFFFTFFLDLNVCWCDENLEYKREVGRGSCKICHNIFIDGYWLIVYDNNKK